MREETTELDMPVARAMAADEGCNMVMQLRQDMLDMEVLKGTMQFKCLFLAHPCSDK